MHKGTRARKCFLRFFKKINLFSIEVYTNILIYINPTTTVNEHFSPFGNRYTHCTCIVYFLYVLYKDIHRRSSIQKNGSKFKNIYCTFFRYSRSAKKYGLKVWRQSSLCQTTSFRKSRTKCLSYKHWVQTYVSCMFCQANKINFNQSKQFQEIQLI